MKTITLVLGGACLVGAAACSDDEHCDVAAQSGCDEGLVCENVEGSETPACFQPVLVRGDVFDLADDAAIEGARVVAIDVNRAAASDIGASDADGRYQIWIPSSRDADGNPIGIEVT